MAKTELFKRVANWRIANNRDPITGRILRGRRESVRTLDDSFLVLVALRMAADHTSRDDLRPHYERIAREIERERRESIAAGEFDSGEGI